VNMRGTSFETCEREGPLLSIAAAHPHSTHTSKAYTGWGNTRSQGGCNPSACSFSAPLAGP
jgi:hypothetical protein